MLRFADSASALTAKDLFFKVGKTRRIFIRYTGTNQAAQTVATSDLGVIAITRDGVLANYKATEIGKDNQLRYGIPLVSSAVGAAFDTYGGSPPAKLTADVAHE